jgi:hypothetical protein
MAGRLGGQVTLCVICTVHNETMSAGFFGLASKPRVTVFQFGLQNRQLWFGGLSLKIIAMVSWFGPQNQVGDGLSVTLQNRWEEDGAGHTSRSSSLLHLESQVRVF